MTDESTTDGAGAGATRELPALAPWVVVSRSRRSTDESTASPRRMLVLVAVGAVVVLLIAGVVGVLAARKLAERQAVNDAANTADLLAEVIVQPALTDAVATGDPAAVERVATALTDYMPTSGIVRVKLWNRTGTVVWSDERRLIGQQFTLDDEELAVFRHPRTVAAVSDLDEPENVYERGRGQLLEAYRPVWTPDGTPMLFEAYLPYTEVDAHAGQLARGFAGVTISSLLLFAALLIPLVWQLLTRLRSAQRQREQLLERAVEASAEERRRIAGTLHDGVVQELAATSFSVSGAATRARQDGDTDLASDLDGVAATVRDSIGGLRTLLVDIYPETLETAGLLEVLRDLAGTLRSRDIEVDLRLPEVAPALGVDGDRLVFRIAHECLQNVQRHSSAAHVRITLADEGGATVLEVADDGVGFDPDVVLASPEEGHFGLRVLADLASAGGGELAVSTAPGAGCRWRLRVPR